MIELNNIHKSFGKSDATVHALRGINSFINKNEMVAIMGKSGSGKSTLLNILGGLISMDCGKYLFHNKPINFNNPKILCDFRRDKVGFIVQYFALVDDMNVFENIAMPLRYQKRRRNEIKQLVNAMLDRLGISEKAKAYPDELSGGQQQRVAIARAIVKEPDIILADEPTGALDEETGKSVLDLFNEIHQMGKMIIIVTHDEKVAERCERIIHLKDGMVLNE